MSLSDFSRTDEDDIAALLGLAATVTDRTPREQKALTRLAEKIDRQRNRQTSANWPAGATLANRTACSYRLAEDLPRPEVTAALLTDDHEALAKILDHPKTCPCRGEGLAHQPPAGWSRLADEVAP